MASERVTAGRRALGAMRSLYAGRRLLLAVALGAAVFVALPPMLSLPARLAAAWVAGVALFLALTAVVVIGATPESVRRRARLFDQRRPVILAIIVAAATVSVLALGFTLQKAPQETALALALRIILAGLTVVVSWTLTHTVFAIHYAHHYYGDGPAPGSDDDRGGLAFPGEAMPDYWDFLYYSFVVGMTCQVSDVQVTSRPMRRVTLLHGVLSFFFNTVILALAVNLLASSL